MADTVTGFTAARMQEIEDNAIVGASVVGDDLIMTRHDTTTFNAGSVRGVVGPMNPDGNPAGTIIMGGWASDPAGYLIIDGRLITGGVATHPDVAAIYPGWVVGGNLQLPNADGAVPLQGGTPGVVSGSMTHTLSSVNQLPSHSHAGPSHTHAGPSHTHTFSATTGLTGTDHTHHWSGSTFGAGTHTHNIGVARLVYELPGAGFGGTIAGGLDFTGAFGSNGDNGHHSHTFSGTSGPMSVNHSHPVSGTTAAGGTGSTGSGGNGATSSVGSSAPIDHTPKNLTVRYAVKT